MFDESEGDEWKGESYAHFRNLYYSIDGMPLTLHEWAALFGNREYKQIDRTNLEQYYIGTIWLGLDHNFSGDGPPLIFESMVFARMPDTHKDDMWMDLDCQRYATLEEAQYGHLELVAKYRAMEEAAAQHDS